MREWLFESICIRIRDNWVGTCLNYVMHCVCGVKARSPVYGEGGSNKRMPTVGSVVYKSMNNLRLLLKKPKEMDLCENLHA